MSTEALPTSSTRSGVWERLLSSTSSQAEIGTAASSICRRRNSPWGNQKVKLVINLRGVDSIPPAKLAEIVDRVLNEGFHADPATQIFGDLKILRESNGSLVIELSAPDAIEAASIESSSSVESQVEALSEPRARKRSSQAEGPPQSAHGRLAGELRSLTGLPAASLAAGFGISREQYQRWVSGRPISDTRHGQLIYAHTIAAEISRKLGAKDAQVWWRTPHADGFSPEEILRQRNLGALYVLAAGLPDPQPMVGTTIQGLRVQDERWDEEPPEGIDEQDDWSPYLDSGKNQE